MTEKEQWYSNKDLFEMLETFKKEVTGLRMDMNETKTLIRDYNGLRQSINDVTAKVEALQGIVKKSEDNRTEYIGYIIAVISIVFLFLNYLKRWK